MKFTINIELDPSWVLSHRDDDVLPIATLIDEVNKQFDCNIEGSGPSDLSFTVVCDQGGDFVRNKIFEIFSSKYGEQSKDALSVSLQENKDGAPAEGAPIADLGTMTSGDSSDEDGDTSTAASFLDRQLRDFGAETTAAHDGGTTRRSASEANDAAVEKIIAEAQSLVGTEEFVKLAKEIAKAAPEIKKRGLQDMFMSRRYLFAIGDGCGFSTMAALLAKLYSALGFYCSSDVCEVDMPAFTDNDDRMEERLKGVYSAIYRTLDNPMRTVFALDISGWMNKMTTMQFMKVLKSIENCEKHLVVLFRIPYVEKDFEEVVSKRLNDVMTTTAVSFPPASREQVLTFAKNELKAKGFTVQNAALDQIWSRLNEEKSDGRFYGIKTIRKVLDELVYDKITKSRGKCGKVISGKDAASLLRPGNNDSKTAQQMLDALVGNEGLKEQLNAIIAQIRLARTSEEETPCIHMRFVGNPGTGKTTVARIVGKMLKEQGILRVGGFFEVSGRDFCGRYIGETAPKTSSICRDAYGSVLFIDEAYSLYRGDDDSKDFGREALDTLIAEMENHRDDFVVIMAGYTDDMDRLLEGNRGLKSRMPYTIEFPNFTREQLFEIFRSMLASHKHEEQLVDAAKKYFDEFPEDVLSSKEFSNGRYVRNLFERTWAKAALRCQLAGEKDVIITCKDFELATADKDFAFNGSKKTARLGFY